MIHTEIQTARHYWEVGYLLCWWNHLVSKCYRNMFYSTFSCGSKKRKSKAIFLLSPDSFPFPYQFSLQHTTSSTPTVTGAIPGGDVLAHCSLATGIWEAWPEVLRAGTWPSGSCADRAPRDTAALTQGECQECVACLRLHNGSPSGEPSI